MTGEPLDEPGPKLARKNRRLLAERTAWPAGVVEECEAIEVAFPDWYTTYHPGQPGWSDQGFYARAWRWRFGRPEKLYGKTPDELRAKLREDGGAPS